ncbi:MAG TPA: ACP phosphodiesterase [Parasegetibacter sp.]|jgi:acyl carrier protein phosphodiesterase
MNFLAHAYLSFNEPEILVGNIISDFVKGKTKFSYPPGIQKGISLHRAIDEFTDKHEATIEAKQFFRPAYGLYASAFIDITYDHFLANDLNIFRSKKNLADFSMETLQILDNFTQHFPGHFGLMFPYMKSENWLYNYHSQDGIFRSFGGLVRRAAYLSDSAPAEHILVENYESLQLCYNRFFPDLVDFASHQLNELLSAD